MPERGGRSGAGRKSNADRLLDAQEAGRSLASWFTPVYQESKWKTLLESRDGGVQFRALAYWMDPNPIPHRFKVQTFYRTATPYK